MSERAPSRGVALVVSLAQSLIWTSLTAAGLLLTVKSSTGELLSNPKDLLTWAGIACLYGALGAGGGLTGLVLAAGARSPDGETQASGLRRAMLANLIGGGLQLALWLALIVKVSTSPGGMHGPSHHH